MDAVSIKSPELKHRSKDELLQQYLDVRGLSERLCKPLEREDFLLQAMASTSPAKWHLAHTTWFFETFVLKPYSSTYRVYNTQFETLFNSYYNGVGEQYPRAQRGLLSRPSVEEVFAYRSHVDSAAVALLETSSHPSFREICQRVELGCHHEQQHQELFFTDLKFCWFQNPLMPAYTDHKIPLTPRTAPITWLDIKAGIREIGHGDPNAFCFDNELPEHPQYLADFRIADRLVSNAEFTQFIDDDGYERPELWLSDGWANLPERAISSGYLAPLYWMKRDEQWFEYTLHGVVPLEPDRPVAHLSAYEADAYARWAGARLPTEFEWETSVQELSNKAMESQCPAGQFLSADLIHPVYANARHSADNILGQLWQWTSSAYSAYPGFQAAQGAIGEYNGKFMANQLVLRGGSCATSASHYRHSYRNFFYPPDQWQFTGLRMAQDI